MGKKKSEDAILNVQEGILVKILEMKGDCKSTKYNGKMVSCCGSLDNCFHNKIKCPLHDVHCNGDLKGGVAKKALERIQSIRKLNYLEKLA
jgi:hypothetical protein